MTILHAYIAQAIGLTIRPVPANGSSYSQIELLINSRRDGLLSLRLISPKGKAVRVTDMRGRPRKDRRS